MINLRNRLYDLIFKENEWHHLLVRHMSNIRCSCINQQTMIYNDKKKFDEINKEYRTVPDPECNICNGSGYIFEEFLHKGVAFYPGFRFEHYEDTPMAFTEMNVLTVYFHTDIDLTTLYPNDLIFFIDCDKNGIIKHPIKRTKKWIINDVAPFRLDSSKLEFIRVFAKPAII